MPTPKQSVFCSVCAVPLPPSPSTTSSLLVVSTCATCQALRFLACAGCGASLSSSAAPLRFHGNYAYHASCYAVLCPEPPAALAVQPRAVGAAPTAAVPSPQSLRLKRLPRAAPTGAPAHSPGSDSAFCASSLQGILLRARVMGLVRERPAHPPGCRSISGLELVAFLCASGLCPGRGEALLVGQALLDSGLLAGLPAAPGVAFEEGAYYATPSAQLPHLVPAAAAAAGAAAAAAATTATPSRRSSSALLSPDGSEAPGRRDTTASTASSLEEAAEHPPAAQRPASLFVSPSGSDLSTTPATETPRQEQRRRHSAAPSTPQEWGTAPSTPLFSGLASRLTSAFFRATGSSSSSSSSSSSATNQKLRSQSLVEGSEKRGEAVAAAAATAAVAQSSLGLQQPPALLLPPPPPPPSLPPPPLPELQGRIWWAGWLFKQGHVRLTWRRRWFVLAGASLRYFRRGPLDETAALARLPPITLQPQAALGGAAREELLQQLCPPNGEAPAGVVDIRDFTLVSASGSLGGGGSSSSSSSGGGGGGAEGGGSAGSSGLGSHLAMRLASRVAAHQQFLFVASSEADFVCWVKALTVAMREWERTGS